MKRLTMIVALVLAVAMPMMAERVTPETARKVAATFLNNNGVKTAQLTDLSKVAGFPNLYIFNAEPGFVVMAADDCVQPILGYSFENTFVAKDMPENVRGWLQGYSDEIQYAIESKMKATAETAQQWNDLLSGNAKAGKATAVVGPLIETNWKQDSPYNMYCPGGSVTGCVATAMAQVMKYWNYPETGIGSHSYYHDNYGIVSANFQSSTYDWGNMTNTYGTSSTQAQKQAVATLMFHCGVSVDMYYTTSGSGAVTAKVADALKIYFNYSSDVHHISRSGYSDDKWIALLKSDLDQHRPIQYHGNGEGGGHSFVCDGYNSENYFHFNWGWGGYCDDYYTINNLNPGPGGIGSGANGIYNNNQGAIFGIHPSNCTADVPSILTYTQNGRSVTFKWDAATDAASYNIYRDYNYIGNSTTNSYIETAPYGTHIYIVRSVDSNGELSLSSNTVTILVEVVNDLQVTLSGDNANLSWTAPKWCYPETSAGILTYGDGIFEDNIGTQGAANMYWGHRYLAENLTAFSDMVICKLSFYSSNPGNYEYFIYKGTNIQERSLYPNSKLAHGSFVVSTNGWIEIELDERLEIDDNQDLWVFIYDPEAKDYPATFCNFTDNTEGCYYSSSDPLLTPLSKYNSGISWLIRTYLTDGTYTYNLYQDGTKIAENLSGTSYSGATLNDNAANLFTVKTNYYGGESAASNVAGFAKGTASLASLEMAANDKMTVTENSKLTVTGTLSNRNPANLVIENGAQLIHSSEGVKAMVKKSIAPYTEGQNDGWNFIASPTAENITPSEDNGLIANTYDLYYYDEQGHHWRNYRKNNFNLAFKQGYLYANDTQTTLVFAGTLTPSDEAVSINNLSFSSNINFLKGFNLVGNPFACNANVDKDFYVIDNNSVVKLAATEREIVPCEGIFVKANSDEFTVTFSKPTGAKTNGNGNCLDLVITQDKAFHDRARVRLGEGSPMEKFSLDGDNSTQLTLWQDGQEYAVVYASEKDELPLNFKAAQNGTYTIGIETNSLELEYLHLIDNMTGDNIDLLVTPSYTFDAKTTDYVSRFKLIFKEENKALTGSTTFAYINDGNIIITGANDNVTLQIVDVMGHIIASCGQTRCIPTTGIPAGVYVLRLIDGENVKVQKIVIE